MGMGVVTVGFLLLALLTAVAILAVVAAPNIRRGRQADGVPARTERHTSRTSRNT